MIDVDWEAALDETIVDVLDDTDALDVELTLLRMVAKLRDGHGLVVGSLTKWGAAPIRMERVEGRVVVVAAAKGSGLRRGDEVVAIDARPVEELLTERAALVSGSPQWIEYRLLARGEVTEGIAGTQARVEVLREGHVELAEVVRVRDHALVEFHHPTIERIANGVYYVDLVHADWQTIQRAVPKLARAREIVFDLRGPPQEYVERTLEHLLREPLSKPWMFVPEVVYPDREPAPKWAPMGWNLVPAKPHIGARATFLVGAFTGSSGESVTALVQGLGLGGTVGAATAGANGDVNEFEVPGGFSVVFSGLKVRRLDGTQYQGKGLQPTHPVTRTLAGVRAGRDEVRDAALAAAKRRTFRGP